MEQEQIEQQEKPSFKEMLIGYKDKTTRPFIRFFNGFYIVTTLLAYLYYVVFSIINIIKNGIENPVSIMLLVAVIIYTAILITCAVVSSSFKTAKRRIKRSLKAFKYLKRSITITSSIVAIIALVATLKSDAVSGWTIFVSIVSLIMNFIKVMFALFMMSLSAGTSVLKFGAKRAVKKLKLPSKKNTAPTIEVDAADDNPKLD